MAIWKRLLESDYTICVGEMGVGKTTVAVSVAALLGDEGYPALVITLTRKAAQEMRTRLTLIPGPEADELNVLTFHALGLEMVKANLDYFGYIQDGCRSSTTNVARPSCGG